jgi:hypothetical protein
MNIALHLRRYGTLDGLRAHGDLLRREPARYLPDARATF